MTASPRQARRDFDAGRISNVAQTIVTPFEASINRGVLLVGAYLVITSPPGTTGITRRFSHCVHVDRRASREPAHWPRQTHDRYRRAESPCLRCQRCSTTRPKRRRCHRSSTEI